MLVLHALGHALVISRSLTWVILWARILRFARPSSFAGRGAPGHHQPAARRQPAQDGYGCLTLADNAAPALEIPQAPAAAHQPGQRRADVLGVPAWLPLYWQAVTHHRPAGWRPAYLHGSWDAAVARRYGLMVIFTVPLTVLSCESCRSMGKLKVPALVGVPARTLLKSGAVVSRVRPGGSSLMLLTTDQVYGGVPPWAGRSRLYGTPTVPAASVVGVICSGGATVSIYCWVASWPS